MDIERNIDLVKG